MDRPLIPREVHQATVFRELGEYVYFELQKNNLTIEEFQAYLETLHEPAEPKSEGEA